ncbi:hypothetical protein AVEN_275226-1 [Araneus ventricosus]|uniref:Tc1-like transposase DDE domain-containing protein n=1 Tax=Araneus ventricosus TaxID=182803 RepID=A0A4Y2P0C6_ARAVE|nr:hypothetical protein AVEN_124945-1 [Araneus ventricosus]GBN44572.1 hypothetical protein AVEN_275226-1 [Araneus ventricosus]
MDEWKRVSWSDESRFLIHHVDGLLRIRCLPGEVGCCCSPLVQQVIHRLQDNVPCHKARIVLEWFEELTDEFHLRTWPPNSPDLNPMKHISDVMERQLRAQTPPCPNISTLRDRCLDIWIGNAKISRYKGPLGQRINNLTPKPAVTGHATSIPVSRISVGCCSERVEKAVGRVVIKVTLRGEMKGLPFVSTTTRSEERRGNGRI